MASLPTLLPRAARWSGPERAAARRARPAVRFLLCFAAGLAAPVLILALLFAVLDAAGHLRAPAFANRLSFDEKLRQLRARPPREVEVLLVGSSATLHGLDGAILDKRLGLTGEVLNLGTQSLRLNHIRFLATTFTAHYADVAHLIMVSTLPDYLDCSAEGTAFFAPDDAFAYIEGRGSEIYYQFKYLNLTGLRKRARALPRLRDAADHLDSVAFDRHGSLLLDVPRKRIPNRIWKGVPVKLDPRCYEALRRLALDLEARDIRFTYVIAPMRPGYLEGRDPTGRKRAEHLERLETALEGTGVRVIDAHTALAFPDRAFFDAYHLKRPEARTLTRFLAERLDGTAATDPPRPAGNG